MKIRELVSYYEKEIYHLLEDQMRFPYDNLGTSETIKVYQRFIKDLKQLL